MDLVNLSYIEPSICSMISTKEEKKNNDTKIKKFFKIFIINK